MRVKQLRYWLIGIAVLLCVALALHMRPPEEAQTSLGAASTTTDSAPIEIAAQSPPPTPERVRESTTDTASNAVLAGRLIDAQTREPVRQFTIRLEAWTPLRRAGPLPFRSEAGEFRWAKPPLGEWQMIVTAPGYQRFEAAIKIAADTTDLADLELPMHRARTLSGRVYDEATGSGIANASLAFRDAHSGRWKRGAHSEPIARSQADGTFKLDELPAESVILTVHAAGFARRELTVNAADSDADLEIALDAGSIIAGRLVASDGVTPVAGIIGLTDIDHQSASSHPTEADGRFRFTNLTAGRYRLAAQAREGAVERQITLGKSEKLDDIVIALHSGGTIRGVITGLTAADLQRTEVSIMPAGGASISVSTKPDERGAYSLEGAPNGNVHVQARVANRRLLTRLVEMPASGDVTVDFAFPRTGRLSGRVTRDGQPVAGAGLGPRSLDESQAVIAGTTTSATGDYVIEDLSEGDYEVVVAGHRTTTVRVAGDTVFNIEIPPRASFIGEVLDEQTGAPLQRVEVTVAQADGPAPRDLPRGRIGYSNQFGGFMAGRFDPGDYLVTVYKAGYSMVRERVSMSGSRVQRTYKLRADPGVEVRVRVSGTTSLVQATLIQLQGDQPIYRIPLALDAEGRSRIPSALEGARFSIWIPGYAPTLIDRWNGQPFDIELAPEETPIN